MSHLNWSKCPKTLPLAFQNIGVMKLLPIYFLENNFNFLPSKYLSDVISVTLQAVNLKSSEILNHPKTQVM